MATSAEAAPPVVEAPAQVTEPAAVPAAAAERPAAPAPDQRAPAPEPYVLPAAQLSAMAGAAGLEWVASNAEKVAAAQAAMAAEPKPIHVPREPKPVVVADEGPLVLVETKKDLSQMKLPFEQQQQPPAA